VGRPSRLSGRPASRCPGIGGPLFSEEIRFQYPWRSYQQRVLDDIEGHLADSRLHIIAPPGSGKTVLGLEVVRRLNRPTLILSPTLTIRNQWIDRFRHLFGGGNLPSLSLSLKDPAFLTSSTYQSLHSCFSKGEEGEESDDRVETEGVETGFDLARALSGAGIAVLVLDEAHHLKAEWWKSLTALTGMLDNPVIISLTATPPYDSSAAEWARYRELCGPIDGEIPVPELVREKDLCPHQDLVYLSGPTGEESRRINGFYDGAERQKERILRDEAFLDLLRSHPVLSDPDSQGEMIFDNMEYCSSLIVFLNHRGDGSGERLRKFLGLEKKRIPPLDGGWFECLMTNILFRDPQTREHPLVREILRDFRNAGLTEKRKVRISRREEIDRLIAGSGSKFESIRQIIDHEFGFLGDRLRLVVLTDFVRREFLAGGEESPRFGVVPIFNHLLNRNHLSRFDYSGRIALLCGSLAVIPGDVREEYAALAETYAPGAGKDLFRSIRSRDNFFEVPTGGKTPFVKIMTELFARGRINVIVGTKSLLGEGWDCPEINSLVLATFVGSYMLSNQMRGRAIRSQKGDPLKTSNIWHLLCLDSRNPSNNGDYQMLTNRFRCFIGPHVSEDLLISGLDRLGLSSILADGEERDRFNEGMVALAGDREGLREKWERSAGSGSGGTLVREIRTGKGNLKRSLIFQNTLRYALLDVATGGAYATVTLMRALIRGARSAHISGERLLSLLALALLAGMVSLLPGTVRVLVLALKHGPLPSSFRQMGLAVLHSMEELDMIDDPEGVVLETGISREGTLSCSLKNSTPYAQSVFLKSLEELLGGIDNPRYLITRRGRFLGSTLDYHGVPSLFAGKKDRAELFLRHWNRHMGKSELIYTRNREGRALLLRARTDSLSAGFIEESDMVDCWKK